MAQRKQNYYSSDSAVYTKADYVRRNTRSKADMARMYNAGQMKTQADFQREEEEQRQRTALAEQRRKLNDMIQGAVERKRQQEAQNAATASFIMQNPNPGKTVQTAQIGMKTPELPAQKTSQPLVRPSQAMAEQRAEQLQMKKMSRAPEAAERIIGKTPLEQGKGPQVSIGEAFDRMMQNRAERAAATKASAESFSGYMASLGENYKKGQRNVTPENVAEYLGTIEQNRQAGKYDISGDTSLHSNAQKRKDAQIFRQEAEDWKQEVAEKGPKTDEERRALQMQAEQLGERRGLRADELGLDLYGTNTEADFIHKRPDDYYEENYRDEYDEKMYDYFYGEGAYYDRLMNMQTDSDVDRLEAELDDMWDRLESKRLYELDKADSNQPQIDRITNLLTGDTSAQERKAVKAEEEAKRADLLEELAGNAPAAQAFDESAALLKGGAVHQAALDINSPLMTPENSNEKNWKDEWFLSDKPMAEYDGRSEKDIFNGYYGDEKYDEAMEFLEALRPTLQARKAKAREYVDRENARYELFGMNIGGLAGLETAIQKPVGAAAEAVDMLGSLFGVEGSGDLNSAWHQLGNSVRNVRDERGNIWDEAVTAWFGQGAAGWGKKFNGALYSILDNVVAMGAGKGLVTAVDPETALKQTTAAVQWIMSTGAAADEFAEKTGNGMAANEAAVYAIGSGVIEAITEKYSIEALLGADVKEMLGNGREMLAFLGKNMFTEGSEEVASDVLGMVMDDMMSAINGHESEFRQRVTELTDEGINETDAIRQAMGETWQKFGESFLFGGLSGLVLSGGRMAANEISNFQTGSRIRNTDKYMQDGQSGERNLMQQAAKLGTESKSAALAEQMEEDWKKGKNVSRRRLGRLTQNIQMETQEQAQQAAEQTIEETAKQAMMDAGVQEETAAELAPTVKKAAMDGIQTLSQDERRALRENRAAAKAAEELTKDSSLTRKVMEQIREKTKDLQSIAETTENLAEGKTAEGLSPKSAGEQLATQDEIRQANGERTGGAREAIVDGEFGTVEGITDDGKVEISTGSGTKTVDVSEVKATNFTTAAILRERAVSPEFYGQGYTNTLLKQTQQGNIQNVGRYLQDAYKIRWAAYLGQKMPETGINRQQAEELYLTSREDATKEWQAAQQERKANYRGAGNGRVTLNGAEYGSEAYNKAVESLAPEQRERMAYVADIAKASGIELTFIDTSSPDYAENVHGFENGGGITINLDSYDSRQAKQEGRGHHIVVTMSHEMTHWLQRNNAQGYIQLQDFVLQRMADEGVNVAARAESLMNQRKISMTEAIDEIVANACDQVLGNREVAEQLQKENKGLFQAIKGFVKNLIKRIKGVAVGMEDSASRDAQKIMFKYGNELAKVWLGAYDEVLTGKIAQAEAGGNITKMSQAELDEAYLQAVKDNNTELMQQMVDEAANRAGYTLKVYHGTPTGGFTQFRDWSYFTENKAYADRYNHASASSSRAYAVTESKPMTYELYMNPGKLFDTRKAKEAKLYNKARMEYGLGNLLEDGLPDWTDGRDIIEYIEDNDLSYDTIILNEGADGGYGQEVVSRGVSYVTRANMVKDAAPVVYDDNGNVIPLSERFNKESNDIRFSMAEPVEVNKDGLIAVHNLRAAELMGTLKEGGFTAPSIAIIKAAQGHNKYGNISVVFWPSAIDPRKSTKNKVYGADAYTPTRYDARVEQEIISKEVVKASNAMHELLKGENTELDHELTNWFNDKLYDDETDQSLTDIARTGYNNVGMLAAYQKSLGNDIDVKMTEVVTSYARQENEEAYNYLIDKLHERKLLEGFIDDIKKVSLNEMLEKYAPAFKEILSQRHERFNKLDLSSDMGKRAITSWFNQFNDYLHKGITKESRFDKYATRNALQEKTDEEAFTDWLSGKLINVLGQKGVRNNKDRFTDIGNRRSFKALHDEYTADNVVRAMYKNAPRKGVHADYFKGLMATASKEYKSLSEIRKDAGRLGIISEEEYENFIDEKNREMDAISREIKGNESYPDDVRRVFVEAGARYAAYPSLNTIKNAFKAEGYTLTDDIAAKVQKLMEEAREFATGYFEAKPERLMGFEDIANVILPADTDQKLINALNERSIPYETYDGTNEDRLKKLNSVENVRFSMSEDQMDINAWMMAQTPGKFQTEHERKLLEDYKGLRVKISLSLMRQSEYERQIRQLERNENPTWDDREKLTTMRNKLGIQQDKQARLEQELYEITSDRGYAKLMYQGQRLYADYVEGKTQAQVEAAVDSLLNEAAKAEKSIKRRQAELERMAENNPVRTIIKSLNNRGLGRTVDALRTEYATAMEEGELKGRLAEIILKRVNGEDTAEDIRDLAQDVVSIQQNRAAEEANDALKQLRGMTVVIGPEQQKELKATNSGLREIQRATRGSGIKFVYGDHSSLDSNWQEISDDIVSMRNQLDNDKDSINAFVKYVTGLLDLRTSDKNEYGVDVGDVEAFITASVNLVLNNEAGGLTTEQLAKKIRKSEGALDKALASARETAKTAEDLLAGAKKAAGWAGIMRQDVQATIDYYNETAKQAAQVEKQNVRKSLIETLKSEHTKELIQQEQEFNERMKKDRKARELAADNESVRRQITTVAKRLKNLLTAETDEKNVTEEAKPLARVMTGLLVQHDISGFRRVLYTDRKSLEDFSERLRKMEAAGEPFDPQSDLDWLVVHANNPEDNDYTMRDRVLEDLDAIKEGLQEYRQAEGNGNTSLQERQDALKKVQEAVNEIYSVIRARSSVFIEGRRVSVLDLAEDMRRDMENSRFKGDRRLTKNLVKLVGYGNMTPEYFFKNLRNGAMNELHKGLHEAENTGGLQAEAARKVIEQIAKETGYATWDPNEKHTIRVKGGQQIGKDANGQPVVIGGNTLELTTEQLMALYATWQRERNQMRPEQTAHLLNGGFVLAKAEKPGLMERVKENSRPSRMTVNLLDALAKELTPQQKEYVDRIVKYMSTDLAELGNETSMKEYGIKKFTEQYYFPIKSWGGVLNKSSDSGITNKNDVRAMRQSFLKRVQAGASNAIEIGDFTATAMKHIVGMINFNTVGPAVENINRVLNQQLEYGEKTADEDNTYRRNMRAAFQEAYGENALKYLEQFMQDVNGGTAKGVGNTLFDRLLSTFKKNAVAGSLSVAAQQPLSYIRAAMMINPRYLAAALSPAYYKGSYQEMMDHSGVAVIKQMGKFDMAYGRSMIDWITPEAKKSAGKKVVEQISDKSTILPQLMDNMTWTRMWSACKIEQHRLHPDMDMKSDAFLDMVGERFNEVMRRTQVYDSVLVKSQNMRSTHWYAKTLTSFMAEPTLSLNVLADAWQNIRSQGGGKTAVKALGTFVVSAALQAAAKAVFSTGRSPDKKKNLEENYLYKLVYNLISELNPLGLIPGYNSIIETLENGELTDNSMSVIAKAKEATDNLWSLISGAGDKTTYRKLEDSIGQLLQLATNVPVKNIMRDFRATVNVISGGAAAGWTGNIINDRETSQAVLKYQAKDLIMTEDLIGLINKKLGDAGYKTTKDAYIQRLYDAKKAGNKQEAEDISDYLLKVKISGSNPEKTLKDDLNRLTKADDSLTAEQKIEMLDEGGYGSMSTYILQQLKKGEIDRKTAEKLYREENPKADDKDVLKALDKQTYKGKLAEGQQNYTNYTPLYVAMDENDVQQIREAIQYMVKNGFQAKSIKTEVNDRIKAQYMTADNRKKISLRNAMQIAYKALGFTAQDADKTIESWTKQKKQKK